MHIIYHDYGGSHSSVTAAAVHLGILNEKDRLDAEKLWQKIPHFDGLPVRDHGKIILRGKDEWGNFVYTLGSAYARKIVLNAMHDMIALLGHKKEEVFFINTRPCINTLMQIGGCLTRGLGWTRIGRPIVTKGTLIAYQNICILVEENKRKIEKMREK